MSDEVQNQGLRAVSDFERIRRARGLTQSEVAARVGCSRSLISMAEAGYRPPRWRRLAIAEVLGVRAGALWPAETERIRE
jgi:transcriptional regulator with XRE-family HTH domain